MNIRKSMATGSLLCCLLIFVLPSCSDDKARPLADSASKGSIQISVDESFMPVIAEQIKVYKSDYPAVNITPHYKPEAECIKDLFYDSSCRMAIITRRLTREEMQYFSDSLGFIPKWGILARDAIAIIVNANSPDTNFTMADLRERMSGRSSKKNLIVLDGLTATGTIRFAIDSILKGGNFDTAVVKGVASSSAVIDYVMNDPGAIGMVGISWIGNPEDSAQVNLLKKVKIASVQCDKCAGKPFIKPSQASISDDVYPLVRGLYYLLNENYDGLGSGFAGFMKYERGQLIFKRAYLQPGRMDFDVREVNINIEQ